MEEEYPNETWVYIGGSYDGALGTVHLNGIDLWQHKWESMHTDPVLVRDPIYNQVHKAWKFTLSDVDHPVIFAACEFSNCAWGFYIEKELLSGDSEKYIREVGVNYNKVQNVNTNELEPSLPQEEDGRYAYIRRRSSNPSGRTG